MKILNVFLGSSTMILIECDTSVVFSTSIYQGVSLWLTSSEMVIYKLLRFKYENLFHT